MTLVVFLLRLALMTPAQANALVAGENLQLRAFLDTTTLREARRIGVKGHRGLTGLHRGDAELSEKAWRNNRAQLVPGCPGHDDPLAGWSTRGPHGLMAATHWSYLPAWLQCSPPWIFNLSLVSAYVAAKKARRWCGRGYCSRRELNSIWANGRPPEE